MRFIRMLAGLLVVLCVTPPLVLVAAILIGRWTGCEADPETPHACQLIGGDYGNILYALAHFGENAGAAILALAAVLVTWVLLEILHWTGKPAQPKKPARQTPAISRNRKRGS
jgi:hypothetical protein